MSIKNHFSKEKLIEKIQHVYETDVGDFKRKTTLYLNQFTENQTDPSLKNKIQQIKTSTLYKELSLSDEMENIDHLRFALLEQLKNL